MIGLALAFGLASGSASSVDVEVSVGIDGGDHDISYFHEQLAPAGTWIEVGAYGKVWQPSVVLTDGNWRPYVNNGHWRYTDAGWYWDSSYSWGWAVFHYGRWNYDERYKWIWQPDVTWAPAWVSWRHSDSVYGWAPLPFGSRFEGGTFVGVSIELGPDQFNFVPSASFLSLSLGTVVLPRSRARGEYGHTTIIKNSYIYNDNRVINNGIPLAEVAKATKLEIKPVTITNAKTPTEKSDVDGKVSAFRPKLKGEKHSTEAIEQKDRSIPAEHVTRDPTTDPNAKAPIAKTAEKDADTKAPNKDPDSKTATWDTDARIPERDHNAKAPVKASDAKTLERESEANGRERATDAKHGEKDSDAKTDAMITGSNGPELGSDANRDSRGPQKAQVAKTGRKNEK
jgi:predicted nucleotidyltransferase